MKTAFRLLPYCYLALALICIVSVGSVLRNVVLAARTHDEDVLTPSQLVPMFTFSFLGAVFLATFVGNAVLLFRRRRRKTSLILASVTCLAFPLGTALGAVSIFLLTRNQIRDEYAQPISSFPVNEDQNVTQ